MRAVEHSPGRIARRLRERLSPSIAALAALFLLVKSPDPASGQGTDPGCCSRFDFVLERTLLRIDVVRLGLAVDQETGARVRELLQDPLDGRDLEDSVTAAYMDARHADIELAFLRSIGMDQFLGGREETLETLVKGGYLDEETATMTARYNEERFAFLADTGIRDGDRLTYSLRGDTVRTRYTSESGAVRMDDLRVGPSVRVMLLGSFFAPGTNFHEPIWDRLRAVRDP